MVNSATKNIKEWIIRPKKSEDIIEQILLSRNIDKDKWSNFLNPNFAKDLHDPFLLSGMDDAVNRIKLAIDQKEKIGIFSDYDADGIPAAALLADILENKFDLKISTYIPTRREGYGLNKTGIDYLKNEGVALIITADLGIREIENTEYIKSLGMDVIITDHHEPGEELPQPLALINPKLKDSKYPFRELSGGGVVFKLIQAISAKLGIITESDLKWALDLVAITTICDVVPLVDENRVFAKFGLVVLAKTKRMGLKRLYKIAEINLEKIDTYTVGFQVGPRINAPGRMDHTNESYELLRSTDPILARNLAIRLDEINRRRQAQLDEAVLEAEERVKKNNLLQDKIICLESVKWQGGIIGLVAGRIMEKFNRPTVVFEKGESLSKGSARSIDGLNLVQTLEELKDILEVYGGHAKAAGLTIKNENLPEFYQKIKALANQKLEDEDLIPKIEIDDELTTKDLNLNLYEKIKKLEPFGMGNSRPVFCLRRTKMMSPKMLGQDGRHLRFNIASIRAIAFGFGHLIKELKDQFIDIAFTIDLDTWNGNYNLQLKIVDIKLSEDI